MGNKYLVCLICCEEFKGSCGGGDLGRKEENVESLKQFCEVILEEEHVDGLNDNLSKFLNNPNDNLSICGDCLDLIKVVTEARLSAKCVEESVGKLQMLLLRELRRLQGRLELFWGYFRKMEETLANGDLKFMENGLDKSYSERSNEGRKRFTKLKKLSEKHLERKREIFRFRGKICEVFRDFHQFKSKLVDKFPCNPATTPLTSSKKMVDVQVQVEIQQNIKYKIYDKQSSHDNDKGLSPPSELPQSFNEICEETSDHDENCGDMDPEDEPMHLDNFNDNDSDKCTEDNQIVTKPTNLRESLRNRKDKKKYNESSSDDDEEDPKKEKEEEDGEEYEPNEPINNTISCRAQYTRLLKQHESHLAPMSPFQRNLVRSVIKCQCLAENMQMRIGPENTNLFQRHMTYLSYSMKTQLITLSDIPIKILCQAEEEDGKNGLLCVKCDFKVSECPKMQTIMYDHVFSKHLHAYQCPHCKDNRFGRYEYYRMHLWRCRQQPDVFKVDCEICGRTLSDGRALRNHKWTHMNEAERKEALETGYLKKDPNLKSTKGGEKTFQCDQCGKGFSSKKYLRRHEGTHQDKGSRERVMCPKCGKSFLESGYKYHVNYNEICGEDEYSKKTETCGKCGKVLKNRMLLKRHLKDMHAEVDLKPWICDICGKGFRKKMALKMHETMHTGEKPWNCGKCGQAFSRQDNMKRHEKTCGK